MMLMVALTMYWIPIAMTMKPTIREMATMPEVPRIFAR